MSDIPSAVGHLLDEKLCSTLINSIRGIVWEADPLTFRFSFVSPHAKEILGFPLVPCNIIYFDLCQSMLYWRQFNQGGRHVAKISSNTYRAGTQRA
jgi:hypothetical protein